MNKKNAIPKYLNNNFPDYATQLIYITKTCVNTFGQQCPQTRPYFLDHEFLSKQWNEK
jgi:hypothetical protein